MKNPSLLLLILFAIITALGFVTYAYLDWQVGLFFLFAGGILGGSVLIFKKEINLWINKRYGRSLSDKEISYLVDNFPMLDHIPVTQHQLFYQKLLLFCLDKEIISQDPAERVYHPAVLLCGAYATYFEMKNPRPTVPFPAIPVYVFYGHPFPSPQFPESLHISEYFEEDGALLFSVPHMMKGNDDPARFLNILLYESARVAMIGLFESVDFPSLDKICKIGGYTAPKLEEYLGLKRDNISVKALALSLYFVDIDRFTTAFPRLGDLFESEFTYRRRREAAT